MGSGVEVRTAPSMSTPIAGWNTSGHSGNHASKSAWQRTDTMVRKSSGGLMTDGRNCAAKVVPVACNILLEKYTARQSACCPACFILQFQASTSTHCLQKSSDAMPPLRQAGHRPRHAPMTAGSLSRPRQPRARPGWPAPQRSLQSGPCPAGPLPRIVRQALPPGRHTHSQV